MLRRNGTSETLKVPISSYPCKYASFKRVCKMVAISALKLYMIYFNYSKIKTKKRSGKIWEADELVEFRAGPLSQDPPHLRPWHSLRPRSVALAPHWVSLMPYELPLTPALVNGFLPYILRSHFRLRPWVWKLSFCFSSIFWDWNST